VGVARSKAKRTAPLRQRRLPFADAGLPLEGQQDWVNAASIVPADYLAGLNTLPDELTERLHPEDLDARERRRAARYLQMLKRQVRTARKNWERSTGKLVVSEPPWKP
jgi:hypothetical protein